MTDEQADNDLAAIGQNRVLNDNADVGRVRERNRLRRLARVSWFLWPILSLLTYRLLTGRNLFPDFSWLGEYGQYLFLFLIFSPLILITLVPMLVSGRSPHVLYRPSEIDIGLEDVVGLGIVKEEVIKTLNLFLAYKTFKDRMGGNPRRAILFEGPPGTGKTYMAKAMAREAGVPFLFVSSSAFVSMYQGATSRKIRSYFKALRKHALLEGGAIGFIEEIDAIATARSGMNRSRFSYRTDNAVDVNRATGGSDYAMSVNELLIQMQSFDTPTRSQRINGWFIDRLNSFLPVSKQLKKGKPEVSNILLIGATNRASDLDPAILRPGRFDRSIHFDLPSRRGRREIIDYYLAKKAHTNELDKEERRDQLAAMTHLYSPVMIEHLFDEALVWALRQGRESMTWSDIAQAKMTTEIGLKQPVEYTDEERATIATHESGHAVVAHFVGVGRKLEVLSIIKRADALGLLAHSDVEERFTKTRTELLAGIKIAFGGMVSEEMFFGESGTGPSGDLTAATRTAALMVGAFGMAGSLISFDAVEAPYGAGIVGKVLGDDEGRAAVERILNTAKEDVRKVLDDNRHVVVALRDALLQRDELVGDEILTVIKAAQLHKEEATAEAEAEAQSAPVAESTSKPTKRK